MWARLRVRRRPDAHRDPDAAARWRAASATLRSPILMWKSAPLYSPYAILARCGAASVAVPASSGVRGPRRGALRRRRRAARRLPKTACGQVSAAAAAGSVAAGRRAAAGRRRRRRRRLWRWVSLQVAAAAAAAAASSTPLAARAEAVMDREWTHDDCAPRSVRPRPVAGRPVRWRWARCRPCRPSPSPSPSRWGSPTIGWTPTSAILPAVSIRRAAAASAQLVAAGDAPLRTPTPGRIGPALPPYVADLLAAAPNVYGRSPPSDEMRTWQATGAACPSIGPRAKRRRLPRRLGVLANLG